MIKQSRQGGVPVNPNEKPVQKKVPDVEEPAVLSDDELASVSGGLVRILLADDEPKPAASAMMGISAMITPDTVALVRLMP